MDSQTAVAIQSLLDSQTTAPACAASLLPADEDVFQCGKCLRQFGSLPDFVSHKQSHCIGDSINGPFVTIVASKVESLQSNPNNRCTVQPDNRTQIQEILSSSVHVASAKELIMYQASSAGYTMSSMMNQVVTNLPGSSFCALLPVTSSASLPGNYFYPPTLCLEYTTNESILPQNVKPYQLSSGGSSKVLKLQPIFSQDTITRGYIEGVTVDSLVDSVPLSSNIPPCDFVNATPELEDSCRTITIVNATNQQSRKWESCIGSTLSEINKPNTAKCEIDAISSRRKFKCNFCEKTFTKNFDVQQHQRSHTGEQPYQCVVCGRAFSQKSNVKKHMLTHKVWPSNTRQSLVSPSTADLSSLTTIPSTVDQSVTLQSTVSETLQHHNLTGHIIEPILPDKAKFTSGAVEVLGEQIGPGVSRVNGYEVSYVVNDDGGNAPAQMIRTKISFNESVDRTNTGKERVSKTSHVVVENCYSCQYCGERCKKYSQLKTHMLVHKDEQVFKCTLKTCGVNFQKLDLFLEHIKQHEDQINYQCRVCYQEFHTLHELNSHQYSHRLDQGHTTNHEQRQYSCVKCNINYSTPEALQNHNESVSHSHPCPHCQKIFTCERYLRRHLIIHGKICNYICDICKKSFKTEHYLRSHLVIHTDEKPFPCTQCSQSFNRKDKLKRHMLIHDTIKRYKCPFRSYTGCMKEFNRPDKLKSHIISHSGAKPHNCSECGKMFTRRPHLREHERVTHRRDYRYRCPTCGQGFIRKKLCEKHCCTAVRICEPATSSDPTQCDLSSIKLTGTKSTQVTNQKKATTGVRRRGRPSKTCRKAEELMISSNHSLNPTTRSCDGSTTNLTIEEQFTNINTGRLCSANPPTTGIRRRGRPLKTRSEHGESGILSNHSMNHSTCSACDRSEHCNLDRTHFATDTDCVSTAVTEFVGTAVTDSRDIVTMDRTVDGLVYIIHPLCDKAQLELNDGGAGFQTIVIDTAFDLRPSAEIKGVT